MSNYGLLAQLVQSAALTEQRSLVRTQCSSRLIFWGFDWIFRKIARSGNTGINAMNRLLLLPLTILVTYSFAQSNRDPIIFHITSAHSSFPDTGRAKGYHYDDILYSAAEHYNDSSVLIVVPPHLQVKKGLDIICWFHGWRNNIDSVPARYDLIKQFLESNRNAVLVLAETAKDAPDSYGGKLEQNDQFKMLLSDVLDELKRKKKIDKNTEIGHVTLAGHSGAFRVIAYILQNGGVEVGQTILFDALYSQVDKFTNWIQADQSHQFVNLYTNKGGGTDEVSIEMMDLLNKKNIHFIKLEEKDVNESVLKNNKIIFIHSLKEHNDVINRPDYNFRLYIENPPL